MVTITQSPSATELVRRGARLAPAILSAAAFGLSGSLAKSLLDIGWSPGAVVVARVSGAFLALLVPCLLLLRSTGLPTGAQARRMVAYGVVAVALVQLCFFSAVQYLSVGVALLLEYLAPVLLIGWHWWRRGARPAATVLAGAGIAMAGMVLVLDLRQGLVLHPVGVLWGLAAAVGLCAYFVLSEANGVDRPVPALLMTTVGTGIGSVVVLGAGMTGFLPLTFGGGNTALAGWSVPWWVPVALLVLVAAVVAYLTGIIAVRRLGSSIASFVALSELVFAVLFAMALLGQRLTVMQAAGGLLVLAGIAVVQRPSRR